MGSVRPGGEEVPIDGVVEGIRTGEVFAHRHVLRNTGKAFKRPAGTVETARHCADQWGPLL